MHLLRPNTQERDIILATRLEYLSFRDLYRPKTIKLLLVAESPPDASVGGQDRSRGNTEARNEPHCLSPTLHSTSSSRTELDVCTRTGDRKDCRGFSKAEIRWSIS